MRKITDKERLDWLDNQRGCITYRQGTTEITTTWIDWPIRQVIDSAIRASGRGKK